MVIKLSKKDRDWINIQYPDLKINSKSISGNFNFNRAYRGYDISDSYKLDIKLNIDEGHHIPKVSIATDKIKNIAQKHNITREDLHLNDDDTLCLTIKSLEHEYFENSFTIQEFLKNCVENYLYWVSYYNEVGFPPWAEYAHGKLGYIELFSESKISTNTLLLELGKDFLVFRKISLDRKCLCGKDTKLKTCHPLIYNGIEKIQNLHFLKLSNTMLNYNLWKIIHNE